MPSKYRRIIALLTALIMLISIPAATLAAAAPVPDIDAEAYMLFELNSGELLAAKNADKKLYPASLTKIMTALIVLEQAKDLDTVIRAPGNFMNVGQSSAGILPREKHTVLELLYALLVRSANDAAQVLAIDIAGSEAKFVDMMNAKAEELGMKSTHFMNPHGLHHENHYTTAADMMKLTQKALQNELFCQIVATSKITLPWNDGEITFQSTNKLYGSYEGIKGVKTGTTTPAGSCLIANAEREDKDLLAIVLKSKNAFETMPALLDYGFDNFEQREVAKAGTECGTVAILNGKQEQIPCYIATSLTVPALRGAELKEYRLDIPEQLEAPVQKGDKIGTLYITDNFDHSYELDICAAKAVERHTFALSIVRAFRAIFAVLTANGQTAQ